MTEEQWLGEVRKLAGERRQHLDQAARATDAIGRLVADAPRSVNLSEAARLVGVSRYTIYQWRSR